MVVHKLKSWPHFFTAVKENRKPFEVRKNDRAFQVGDELLLEEFVPKDYYEDQNEEYYTGNVCHRKITYILKGGEFGVDNDTVILGLSAV